MDPTADASDLVRLSATAMAQRLSDRSVSAVELCDAHIARLEALQTTVRPLAVPLFERARRAAVESDQRRAKNAPRSALDGVPCTVKENLDLAGTPSTLGLPSRRGHTADTDAVSVRLLQEQGLVVLGKTNVSQALLFRESKNPVYGESKNPHPGRDGRDRTPGGSSGGEAAAIAACGSPFGLGTDIGGSIRVPAHFSGVCGLKPTVDRVSNLGSQGAIMGQEVIRGQLGPMARSVDDLALLYVALDPVRAAQRDPRVPPLPAADGKNLDVKGMRIGFFVDDGLLTPSLACQRATLEAVERLQRQGATVEPVPALSVDDVIFTYTAALSADGAETLRAQLDDDIEPALTLLLRTTRLPAAARKAAVFAATVAGDRVAARLLGSLGEKSVRTLWALTRTARTLAAQELARWDDLHLDALLCPPHATPALPTGASRDFALGGALSMRFNLLNFPAGVVPVTTVLPHEEEMFRGTSRLEKRAADVDRGSAGLPVGVQVAARPYREDVCLAVMRAVERAA